MLLTLSSMAQEAGHLQFKGIPLDGNYKVFAQKLVQKGFRQLDARDGIINLSGTFLGQQDVLVSVNASPGTDVVYSVVALLEAEATWAKVESLYRGTVEVYKDKYGEPKSQVEKFSGDPRTDLAKLTYLKNGQCNFITKWKTAEGEIYVFPVYTGGKYFISCTYMDKQNIKAQHQSLLEDI